MIVTSSSGATVQIWDAATGRPLGKPLQHAADVIWLVFDRDGATPSHGIQGQKSSNLVCSDWPNADTAARPRRSVE